jgi:hypothetical protein
MSAAYPTRPTRAIKARLAVWLRWAGLVFTGAIIATGAMTWRHSRWFDVGGVGISLGRGRIIGSGPPPRIIGNDPLEVVQARIHSTWDQDEVRWRSLDVGWARPFCKAGAAWAVSIPLWMPCCAVGLPTALCWWRSRRTARLTRNGCCLKCSYDRGGLAADAKCPECGTVPAPATK